MSTGGEVAKARGLGGVSEFKSKAEMADAEVALFDPSIKKKRRPKKKTADAPAPADENGLKGEDTLKQEDAVAADDKTQNEPEEYSYEQMLHRVFELVGEKSDDKRSKRVPLPEAFLVGTSRTLWSNFPAIVKALNRNPQHLLTFVIVELGTTANLDGSGRVVIRGRFMPKQLESLLKRYIAEYVVCKTCNSRDTILKKENRLHFLVCQKDGSTRSVPPLNKGYVHNIRRKPKS